jgi:shikimate kinase
MMTSQPDIPPLRIVLTGFMGSGKSTVGPILAERLGWRFVDVDEAIETEAGASIADIFARFGESTFRDREHATIARLVTGQDLVIALGGGAIEREDTRNVLLSASRTLLVHLDAKLETALARCAGTEGTRPVLADHANLRARYDRRLPLYRMAHLTVNTDSLNPSDVAKSILQTLGLSS